MQVWAKPLAIIVLLFFCACVDGPHVKGGKKTVPPCYADPPVVKDVAEPLVEKEDQSAKLREAAISKINSAIIYFDFDNAQLRPDSIKNLDEIVQILTLYSDIYIEIQGHCDERGSNSLNQDLGGRRAASAMNYLIQNNIAGPRLTAASFGEQWPDKKEHNEAAWANNRRCEFFVID